ncbi:Hypp6720 [Branchiostoma lanceolatum]|uniref:Hypp6720 protein n=1 Tax=Branchiostoma lanceolatum TaxID=7740 RepID=A0A8J9YVF8_BRALA|nr:Hypp6720 [Branchiostoma lanceolatum]
MGHSRAHGGKASCSATSHEKGFRPIGSALLVLAADLVQQEHQLREELMQKEIEVERLREQLLTQDQPPLDLFMSASLELFLSASLELFLSASLELFLSASLELSAQITHFRRTFPQMDNHPIPVPSHLQPPALIRQ